jgi:pseudooxynicotine oxidase
MLLSLLSMNMQSDITDGGFFDHLRWWALGNYDLSRMFEQLGRYKLQDGTTCLARSILNDCREVQLLLSTPIVPIDRSNGKLVQLLTTPMNALKNIKFLPPLETGKHDAVLSGPS